MSIVEHAGQSWRENRPGSRIQIVADPTAGESALSLVNQVCDPGVGAPSHTHDFEEILTILEGSAEVWVGATRAIVGPGTSVFVRAGTVHGFRNVGQVPLRLQGVITGTELRGTYLET